MDVINRMVPNCDSDGRWKWGDDDSGRMKKARDNFKTLEMAFPLLLVILIDLFSILKIYEKLLAIMRMKENCHWLAISVEMECFGWVWLNWYNQIQYYRFYEKE